MTMLPFAEFRPDEPDLADATTIATGVIARTAESYGPFSSLAPYSSNAMDGQCIGTVAVTFPGGSILVYAGTTDKLYQIDSSAAWNDVSGTAYTTAQGDSWEFAIYNNRMIATNFGNPIQTMVFPTDTVFSDLSADAPQARHMCTPKNFVMVGNTFDPVGGLAPARVWWSASGDPTTWPTPGSDPAIQTMSDYNDFNGSFGEVMGLVDSLANADVAIFFRHAVWRGLFVGPPDVFDFFPAENVRGCPASNSIVALGNMVYYLGEDGFYVFDGAQSVPIGADKVDKWFFGLVNQSAMQSVIGAPDVINKAVIWIFPSIASSSGEPDTAIIYRWDIQRWSTAAISADWVARYLAFGVTLDSLYSLGFTELDLIPYSLDSRVWVGGALQLGAVDSNHKLAFFNGTPQQAQIGTKVVQITPGRRSFVQSVRPVVQINAGTPTIAVSGRVNMFDTEVFGPEVAPDASGECPQRNDARYHRARVTIPAGASWSHATAIDATAIPGGWR